MEGSPSLWSAFPQVGKGRATYRQGFGEFAKARCGIGCGFAEEEAVQAPPCPSVERTQKIEGDFLGSEPQMPQEVFDSDGWFRNRKQK